MSKAGKFTLGAIVGAAVGVVAGFLTAPKSGKETRADLKKKADEAKKNVTEKVGSVKEKASNHVETAKTEADKLRQRTANAARGAREGFNKKVE